MLMWSMFALLMTVMLIVDLGLNGKSHTVSFREALTWSAIWVGLALLSIPASTSPWEAPRRWSFSAAT